jgi:hypothetical protein
MNVNEPSTVITRLFHLRKAISGHVFIFAFPLLEYSVLPISSHRRAPFRSIPLRAPREPSAQDNSQLYGPR